MLQAKYFYILFQVLLICGKWTSLIFKEINKFSILPCVLNQEVKKVEFHVLIKIKSQLLKKQFLVESHVIKQKIKHLTLSFLVIIVGFRPKHCQQLTCSIMINSHHKQHKFGNEMFWSILFINTMLIMDLLLKSTESISRSLKMGFSMFKVDNQLTWIN